MKVICELDIGNDDEHAAGTKVILEGDPTKKSGFINLRIGDVVYELRPSDVLDALQRVRSDKIGE